LRRAAAEAAHLTLRVALADGAASRRLHALYRR
jgi:hypothetical protein